MSKQINLAIRMFGNWRFLFKLDPDTPSINKCTGENVNERKIKIKPVGWVHRHRCTHRHRCIWPNERFIFEADVFEPVGNFCTGADFFSPVRNFLHRCGIYCTGAKIFAPVQKCLHRCLYSTGACTHPTGFIFIFLSFTFGSGQYQAGSETLPLGDTRYFFRISMFFAFR